MGANRHVYDAEGYAQFYSDWYTATTYGINPETGKYEEYQTNKDKFPAGYYAFPTQANLDKYGITLEQWRGYTQQMPTCLTMKFLVIVWDGKEPIFRISF